MGHLRRKSFQKPLAWPLARRGFVLFFVCVFAIAMIVMVASLTTQKRGEVRQLGRTIEQERLVLFAEAAITEMLAAVKAGVNDRNDDIGRVLRNFWKSGFAGVAKVVYEAEVPAARLPVTTALVAEQMDGRADISGHVRIVIIDTIKGARPSYAGYLELVGKAESKGVPPINIKERRDIKIVDLAYPFLDKYVLFVKSFCRLLNNPNKRLVIKGVTPNDPAIYSFVHLGNRSYPTCPEFPDGAKGGAMPPILLDLSFKEDSHLLGSFFRPAPFQTINPKFSEASNGNLFYAIPPFEFRNIANSFSKALDFHNTPELDSTYRFLVRSSQPYADQEGTIPYAIIKDFQAAGGNPANSDVFKSLVESLMEHWKYQYGYTDYTCLLSDPVNTFVNLQPFTGIAQYFNHFVEQNPQRILGGKMPLLYGEGRDIPVFVEGPVYLRFFKIAFLDEITIKFDLYGGSPTDVPFRPVPLHYEPTPKTFSGKPCTPPIDERTNVLMSSPINSLSINHLFFGVGPKATRSPATAGGTIEGYDVFPALDETLRSMAHIYQNADDFTQDRIKSWDGRSILDLDGISLILSTAAKPLDLTGVEKYRGKGRIIVYEGNCHLGNLSPLDVQEDSLGIYMMFGNFFVKSPGKDVTICASLAATTSFKDNSSPIRAAESGMHFGEKNVTIYGNLLVDNLFELKSLPNGGKLTIVHDPKLYFPDYPVRVSIGEQKSLLAVDYSAE